MTASTPSSSRSWQGSLAAIEKEVETAIGRTSRSPMIRDAHDFRAGIHDRRLRKLTGRSYSALVHPVVRDFPLETMRPGDVFFHNDVYLSEGGIGHLPDLCVTVPVFVDGEVVAFVQAFGHHDDIGGACPGSMPSGATEIYQEGLMVPPIRLWDQGVPNQAALTIMTRNSRMPDSLAADLDAECSACLMGARRLTELFERYGRATVEACFDAILDATTETFRREVLAKIPEGSGSGRTTPSTTASTSRGCTPSASRSPRRPTGSSSTSPARAGRPAGRSTTAATTPTATSSRSGSRRSCATSPTPPSGWPSSTSTRASSP